ncbi:TetR/AcrR family transcriptional regulator [Bacillus sp. 165]|uniref:TetR/AcrR family transcriptional regulator n=1 Tax=Bacillus sp. 165 TaxID=1529117 RepID=UPI001ADB1002|nr:TetR/AcrR family transcriptional regulator [Bacillus sp. 165]MBO9130691.1 TetR/AcrR family transcriptional regulator [Bacillus sp. 165]
MSTNSMIQLMMAQANTDKKMTEKQKQIVETAIQMFAEKGYTATSTSEIAKAAGVAEGTIFRHFGTKENLLLSVIAPFVMESVPVLADEFIHDVVSKPYERFESFLTVIIKNRLAFLEENKAIFKILMSQLLHRDDLRSQFIQVFETRGLKHINAMLELGKQRGELIDLPNTELLRQIGTSVFGYFMARFVFFPNVKWDDPLEVDRLVRFILQGIGKQT